MQAIVKTPLTDELSGYLLDNLNTVVVLLDADS